MSFPLGFSAPIVDVVLVLSAAVVQSAHVFRQDYMSKA